MLRRELKVVCLGPEVETFTDDKPLVSLASLSRSEAVICVLLLATLSAKLTFLMVNVPYLNKINMILNTLA